MAESGLSKKSIALIPARGGSKGIPKKNIKLLNNKPLIAYCIKAALDSGIFDDVVVSTDDAEIASISKSYGASVWDRDPATATDSASSESAVADYLKSNPSCSFCCLVQATSPLVTSGDFQKALKTYEDQNADSLVTVVRTHRFFWSLKEDGVTAVPKNYDPLKRPRRQDWNGELMENGAFYMFRRTLFDETGSRLGGKMVLHEMAEHTAVEIDSETDWEILEGLIKKHNPF